MTKSFIADTNLWLRYVDSENPQHLVAAEALEDMTAKGRLMLIPQNLVEFWVVATRPKEANGLAAAVLTTKTDYLVTFNTGDFSALPINVLHPKDVAALFPDGKKWK